MEPAQTEITAGEIAAVCAQYDLGVVEQVRPMGRGRSGKAVIKSSRGVFLLKRRAASQADPRRVALSHQVQLHLQSAGLPVPPLVGTRRDNNSMVQIADRVYEVFRYVPGAAYDGSIEATLAAGRALASYHGCMLSLVPAWEAPTASFHGVASLPGRFESAVRRAAPPASPADRAAAHQLAQAYLGAAHEADRHGAGALPRQIVHGDWHPGNLLFRAGLDGVAAVVDHDTVASWPRLLDVAYGALHFSLPRNRLLGSSERPLTLRDNPDEARLAAFCRGYHERCTAPLSSAEAAALPWLMIEAMVADALAAWAGLSSPPPVGSPGQDVPGSAGGFLGLIARKAAWLAEHSGEVARMARGGENPGSVSSV